MAQIEENIAHSFQRVKADIIRLQDEFMQLRETQIRMITRLAKLEDKKTSKSDAKKTATKKRTAKKKK